MNNDEQLAQANDALLNCLAKFRETKCEKDRQRAHFAFQLAVALAEIQPLPKRL